MRVIVSPAAERDIRHLAPDVGERVVAALRALRENPRPAGCLLLRDYHPRTWRIRVGDWRVLYEIDDHAGVVTVTGVRHRSKAY
jgi:mRNA interferase RelE/StbE